MKTKLSELLKQITPLPWRKTSSGNLHGPKGTRDWVCLTGFALTMGSKPGVSENNDAYVMHCANHFPALVEAARFILETTGDDCAARLPDAIERLETALADAETVTAPE